MFNIHNKKNELNTLRKMILSIEDNIFNKEIKSELLSILNSGNDYNRTLKIVTNNSISIKDKITDERITVRFIPNINEFNTIFVHRYFGGDLLIIDEYIDFNDDEITYVVESRACESLKSKVEKTSKNKYVNDSLSYVLEKSKEIGLENGFFVEYEICDETFVSKSGEAFKRSIIKTNNPLNSTIPEVTISYQRSPRYISKFDNIDDEFNEYNDCKPFFASNEEEFNNFMNSDDVVLKK